MGLLELPTLNSGKDWIFEKWLIVGLVVLIIILAYLIIVSFRKNKQDLLLPTSRKILLISVPGKSRQQPLKIINEMEKNYEFLSFQLESDINGQIKKEIEVEYRNILMKYRHMISDICLIVNYEVGIDVWQKIHAAINIFQDVKQLLRIIITDFHLSENPESEKQQLLMKFNEMNVPEKKIKFINQQIGEEQLYNEIIFVCNIFDLNDTIFEITNEEEQQKMMQALTLQINRVQNSYLPIQQNEN